jgi:hypothetical protein
MDEAGKRRRRREEEEKRERDEEKEAKPLHISLSCQPGGWQGGCLRWLRRHEARTALCHHVLPDIQWPGHTTAIAIMFE